MLLAAMGMAKLLDMLQKQGDRFCWQIQRLQDCKPGGRVGRACASPGGEMIRSTIQDRNATAHAGGARTCAAVRTCHAYTPGKRPLPSVAIGASGMAAKRVSRLRYSTL